MPYEFAHISRVVVLPMLSFVSSDKDRFVVTALSKHRAQNVDWPFFCNKHYTPQTLHLQNGYQVRKTVVE